MARLYYSLYSPQKDKLSVSEYAQETLKHSIWLSGNPMSGLQASFPPLFLKLSTLFVVTRNVLERMVNLQMCVPDLPSRSLCRNWSGERKCLKKRVEEWSEPSFGSLSSAWVGTRFSYSFEGIFVTKEEDVRANGPFGPFSESPRHRLMEQRSLKEK